MPARHLKHLIAFMAAAGAMACVAGDELPPAREPKTPVTSFGTILLKGEEAKVGDDGIARFNIRLTKSAMAAYPFSSTLAVVFDDAMMNSDSVACPIIDITNRPRKIEETRLGILAIEAKVSSDEKERVMKARCVVVTPTPSISEIKFLPRENRNDYNN